MRIRHIYITKEGEPMANPGMEYPKPLDFYDFEVDDGDFQKADDDYNEALEKYHSGLLPFEDFNEIKDEMFYQTTGGPHIDMPFESIFNPDTIIPVDLEAEVVEQWLNPNTNIWKSTGRFGYKFRKVLRIKP